MKAILTIISIVVLSITYLILFYRWAIEEFMRSKRSRRIASMVNGFMIFCIIGGSLAAKYFPLEMFRGPASFLIFLVPMGIPGIIGALAGLMIHKFHAR
jgi:hypothetical protein